jgi:hypothetical protein
MGAMQTFPEAEWIYRTSVVMAHMMGLAVPPANAHVLIPKVVERLLFPGTSSSRPWCRLHRNGPSAALQDKGEVHILYLLHNLLDMPKPSCLAKIFSPDVRARLTARNVCMRPSMLGDFDRESACTQSR